MQNSQQIHKIYEHQVLEPACSSSLQAFPYRAVICDLDGTLLNSEHKLGALTVETLQKCAEKGADIFIATGRNYPDVAEMVQKLNLVDVVLITSNGARADYLSGEKVLHHYIDEAVVKSIFKMTFDEEHLYLNSYQGNDWYINADLTEWQQYFVESGYGYQLTDFATHQVREVEKIFFIAKDMNKPQVLESVEQHVQTYFANDVQMTYSMPNCFEIMAKGVNKGKTLAELTAMRGYELMDCIAFGDGLNDVEMLSTVGKGCLMENADQTVKDELNNLEIKNLENIGTHKEEAVAKYLQQLLKNC